MVVSVCGFYAQFYARDMRTFAGRTAATLAAPCTPLHSHVLDVADGWSRRRSGRPVGRPPRRRDL